MAFSPVSLPIQEILLTNFVTDIATISNANDLLLQAKLEDTLNNLEIDTVGLSIGTDNPISYVKAKSFIIQDTGLIFQTGTPTQIIAKLEKNANSESILTVDKINTNLESTFNQLTINDLVVTSSTDISGTATFNNTLKYSASIVSSKETVIVDLSKNGTSAEGFLNLSSSSRKNIFVKLRASSAPNLNYTYDPALPGFEPTIVDVILFVDFDAANPPLQGTEFIVHIADVTEDQLGTSIISAMNNGLINLIVSGGTNYSVIPTSSISLTSNGFNIGVYPNSAYTQVSDALGSLAISPNAHNVSVVYNIDANNNDLLVITGMYGMQRF